MGNLVICDDDKNIAAWVQEQVCNIFSQYGVPMESKIFTSPKEALLYCSNHKTDFILLDIDMPEMNGFELTKKLYKLPGEFVPIIIYMSSQEHFVYESFQYKPFDFLRKKYLEEELELKIGRLIREFDYSNVQIEMVRDEMAYVLLKEVLYFKSDRNRTDAFTMEDNYRCRENIGVIEEKYSQCLIRAGKQYLVNVNYIRRIRTEYILLTNGEKIPVSRRQRKFVMDKYERLKRK